MGATLILNGPAVRSRTAGEVDTTSALARLVDGPFPSADAKPPL